MSFLNSDEKDKLKSELTDLLADIASLIRDASLLKSRNADLIQILSEVECDLKRAILWIETSS